MGTRPRRGCSSGFNEWPRQREQPLEEFEWSDRVQLCKILFRRIHPLNNIALQNPRLGLRGRLIVDVNSIGSGVVFSSVHVHAHDVVRAALSHLNDLPPKRNDLSLESRGSTRERLVRNSGRLYSDFLRIQSCTALGRNRFTRKVTQCKHNKKATTAHFKKRRIVVAPYRDVIWLGPTASARRLASRRTG